MYEFIVFILHIIDVKHSLMIFGTVYELIVVVWCKSNDYCCKDIHRCLHGSKIDYQNLKKFTDTGFEL